MDRRRFVLASLLAAASACGRRIPTARAPRPAAARDTAEIARDAVRGRVGALIHVDRIRSQLGASKITRLGGWGELLEGTSMDPLLDVDRAFIAAPRSHSEPRILVLEHSLDEARAHRALSEMNAKGRARDGHASPSLQRLVFDGVTMVGARTHAMERPVIVADVKPGLFVVLPIAEQDQLQRFTDAGGLPGPLSDEAASFFAFEPHLSLEKGPEFPRSIKASRATLTFGANGCALALWGTSTSEEQARADAAYATKAVFDAVTVNLLVVRMEILSPVTFRAMGNEVFGVAMLSKDDLDWVLSVATGEI